VENNIVNKVWKKYGKEYCEKSVKIHGKNSKGKV
jgi:hypothetical protein